MKTFKNLIGGEWVAASDAAVFETRNPADKRESLGLFPSASREDARRAVEAAQAAFPGWAGTAAPARGAILDKASQILAARLDDIAACLTREEGKTLAESRLEVARARDIFRYYGAEGWHMGGDVLPANTSDTLLFTRREPIGVVSVITPWNFPIAIPAWKIAPALAYGNTLVFKPASWAPQTPLMMIEALVEAGLHPGVVNYITGSGGTLGDEMVTNPAVKGISFTGSHPIGTRIYAKAIPNLTRVQLEMGGKNPIIVLQDADLDLAVDLAVRSGFGLTGQACTAASRVIVEEAIADRFAQALADAARRLRVGNGLESGVQMGPAVSQDQLNTDLKYIEIGRKEGAQLIAGGGLAGDGGFFIQPTVFDHAGSGMRIAQEEIFGPVVCLLRVKNLEEAIAAANSASFGLSAGIVTNDMRKAFAFAYRIEAGVVKINEPTTGLALQAPFGGFKLSSANTFKEQGRAAVEFYTRTKTVYLKHGQ